MSNVNEYGDLHRAPCNDGLWQCHMATGEYNEILDSGGGYSVNLVDFVVNGIEPYKCCRQDMEHAYDCDNGFSKRALSSLLSLIKITKGSGFTPSVTIYRTVPNHVKGEDNVINDGDWITLSPIYAKLHGESRYTNNYHILTMRVPANHIYWDGQHLAEFGFDSRQFEWNKEKIVPQSLDSIIAAASTCAAEQGRAADSAPVKGAIPER